MTRGVSLGLVGIARPSLIFKSPRAQSCPGTSVRRGNERNKDSCRFRRLKELYFAGVYFGFVVFLFSSSSSFF